MESEPVLASAIIFSDGAIRDQNTGKITLVGIFHRFKSSKFPFRSPSFFVTIFVSNIRGRIEGMPVSLIVADEKGNEIAASHGQVTSTTSVNRGDVAEIAFPVLAAEFVNPGCYQAIVRVDGETLGSRIFYAEEQL